MYDKRVEFCQEHQQWVVRDQVTGECLFHSYMIVPTLKWHRENAKEES